VRQDPGRSWDWLGGPVGAGDVGSEGHGCSGGVARSGQVTGVPWAWRGQVRSPEGARDLYQAGLAAPLCYWSLVAMHPSLLIMSLLFYIDDPTLYRDSMRLDVPLGECTCVRACGQT